jgi:hypothetical protein
VSRKPHDWENLASHFEHTDQINRKDVLPLASAEVLEGLICPDVSSIVNQDIDLRSPAQNIRKGLCDLIGLRNINGQGEGAVEFDRIDIPNPDVSASS